MSPQIIYLDHNSTTPIDERVADEMATASRRYFANPASQHQPGRAARQALEDAREQIARVLGASVDGNDVDQLIFTSGATEANNLALRGLAGQSPGRIIISAIEHPSVTDTCEHLRRLGFDIQLLPVDRHGVVSVADLQQRLSSDTCLVSVMLGNNETGVIQPIVELSACCAEVGVALHTDAVQAVGKVGVDFRELGVAAMSFSAHKFHGPRGVGGLIVRGGIPILPILFGGFQQGRLRPGTELVDLPIGMAAALRIWSAEASDREKELANLRERFEQELAAGWPEIVVHSHGAARLPHTSNVSFPGMDRQALIMALDLAGIACSTGSACASGSSEPSPTLEAMACEKRLLNSALRFSFGAFTTIDEIDEAVRRITQTLNDLRQRLQSRNSPAPPPRFARKTL